MRQFLLKGLVAVSPASTPYCRWTKWSTRLYRPNGIKFGAKFCRLAPAERQKAFCLGAGRPDGPARVIQEKPLPWSNRTGPPEFSKSMMLWLWVLPSACLFLLARPGSRPVLVQRAYAGLTKRCLWRTGNTCVTDPSLSLHIGSESLAIKPYRLLCPPNYRLTVCSQVLLHLTSHSLDHADLLSSTFPEWVVWC